MEKCKTTQPQLKDVKLNHKVRCFLCEWIFVDYIFILWRMD
jgi:hypothetical protein